MGYVAILLAEGFEEVEALLPCDFLRRAEIDTKLISISDNLLVQGTNKITVQADALLASVEVKDLIAVVVPGGQPGTNSLAQEDRVIELLNQAYAAGKVIAAVCASPAIVLPKTNFFVDKKFTCTPSQRDKLVDKTNYVEAPAVVDGQLITSRGPGTTAHFAHAIISKLATKERADELFSRSLFSL